MTVKFKSAIRVNKVKSMAQLRGLDRHANRTDQTSKGRMRDGATPGAHIGSTDIIEGFKQRKKDTGAGERKGSPLALHVLAVVSPEFIDASGDRYDPNNPANIALLKEATAWAEDWAGKGSVTSARIDLDEEGGGVVDLIIVPVSDQKNGRSKKIKPVISTNKALAHMHKGFPDEKYDYGALQSSWSDWAKLNIDRRIERGERKEITQRRHLDIDLFKSSQEAKKELGIKTDKYIKMIKAKARVHLANARRSEREAKNTFSMPLRAISALFKSNTDTKVKEAVKAAVRPLSDELDTLKDTNKDLKTAVHEKEKEKESIRASLQEAARQRDVAFQELQSLDLNSRDLSIKNT